MDTADTSKGKRNDTATPQDTASADKVTESSEELQGKEENFTPAPSGNTGSEEGTYTLSSKTSENGESFYQNNDGNIDLADIPDEVFDKIGKPKAPLRLTPSMLKHVFDRHGKEMGLHHADDAIDFVLDVMDNFDHVRQGDKGAIIFSIENGRNRTGRRAVTILLDSQRGEYYGIKTSGYERIEGLHKRPLLWEKGAKETSATGVAPANVTTNETQQGNELTGSASNHGNDPMGKVTESSEELQGKEDKFTPAPIEDGEVQSPSVKYQPIIQATFNKVKREQGIIEPIAEKKRKPFTVFDVTVKEPRRPMFGGVYHDGGMAVATNGVVMFAHKEAYDEAKEAKIITSKGDVIEGEFPDWRGAIPKETIPTGLQTEPLLEFVNGALARMKAEKAKKYEVDGALAYIKFQDGNVVCCQLVDLQKMLRAAKSIGADDLRLGTDKEFLVAESPAGKAIVIIQGEEKARYNAGYNNFAYEAPTVKGEEEVSDGALDNPYPSEQEVEQEANEATEKSKEERNEERVTRTQKKRGRPTKGQQEYRKRKEREARKKEAKELSEEYKRLSEETDELWNILKENKDAPEELVIEGFHSEASWVRATAAEHKNLPPSLLEEAIADPSLRKYAIKNKNITDSQFHHAVKLSLKDGNTEFFRSLNSDDRLTEEESLSIMEFMWKALSKRYGTIYFSSKYPSVLRRFYENHGTQLLAQKVLARDKNTPQDILEKLYESGNEEVRLEIAGNDSVPIPVVLKMLDLPNNLAFRENLAYRRNLPQDIISRLFHDNSKSVRQTIIQFQPLDLDLMNEILKKKNITELGLLAENRNTPLSIQDSILAILAPPKSWGVNGDYYLREIQKKARLGIAQNKRASAILLEDLYNEISSGRLLSDSDLGEAIAEHPNTSKSVLADIYSRFGEKYPRIKNAIEKRSDFTEQEVDENTGNVVLKQFSNVLLSADTESQRLATDAALEGLKRAGVPVEVVSDEQAAAMLGEQKGVELSAKQKRALETASPAMQDHHTVVSSADGTKVLKGLDNTIEEYEKLKGNKPNTLIGDIAKVLGATRHGSNSEYASFETKNGKLVTIRLANHNAKVSTFDNNGESEGLSIVITPKENAKLTNDGEAHITEFYYNAVKLRRAEGKPLVEILKSIKQALYSGEYKDTTGLAEVQEVNVPRAELHMVYHGSGADFDAFDHSHMGEGEGQQAYGWGTYVTEVEGIGEQYAEANHGHLDFDEEAFYDEANEYIEEVFGSRDGLDYAYNDGGFEIFNVNRDPETLNYFLDYFKEHPNEFDSWEDPNEIDVSTLDEKGIEELGRALERSMDDVVREDVQALFEKYMTVPARHLYSVEIPDDTGSNYLDYTKNYADDRSGINTDHLIDALYDEILATDDEHLYDSKQAKKELRKELSELAFSSGKDIYGDISSYLGSDKKASEFLHRQGIVGISYPAQYRSGGREDDARNYVIFDEEDLKITDHVQFMKTPSGTLYGWTVGGKIYLTKDGLNPNTPIHEYTHLWARAMKERNKEGWQSVKELLRDTPVWDEVLKDKNYQDILDDEDAIASEALSRISGQKNAEKMEAEARKMIAEAKDYVDKAKAISLLERMKNALEKFWNWVGKDLFGIKKFSSVDEVTDRVLYDLVNKTKLTEEDKEEIAKRDKLYLEAVERGDMETAQRMVNEAAAQNGYFPNSEYQGTSAYNGKAPYGNGYFLTKEERKEAYENDEFDDDTSLDDYVNSGIDPKNLDELTSYSSYRHADDARKEAIKNLRDVFQNKRQTITMYRSVPSSVKEGSFRNGDWVTPSYAYAVENARIHGWGNKFRVIKQDVPISEVWFDGNDIAEFGYGNEDDFINDKDYLYNNTKNNRKLPDAVTYDDKGKVIPLSKRFNKRKGDPRFQIVDNSQTEEERQIIETAKEGGTYMKAPNGEPTNLNEKQWAQVRTKAFKSWFGDWEKAARIEKLRKSEPVEITGNEYKGKYELNRDSAKAWIKDNLRGEYTIADTGEKIAIGRKGINKVTSHSMGNEAHLKSLIAVPKMLEQSVFITEEKADKLNAQYPTYRYYVVGLNIAGVDYTAKLTIGVDENGNKYYDHALTEIEKGKLLDQINGQAVDNGFMSTGAEPNPSVTDSKDTKLVSILQTNSSKFVDENGEPMVFYHNTNNNFSVFDLKRNGTHTDAGWLGDGFYFYGDENEGSGYGNIKMGVFLNVRDPYYATSEENNQLAEANSRDMSVDFRENLEEEGYDGVFYNGDLRQEAVVFEPNQIKSATDNNGGFSQESDDIRFRQEERAARELAEVNERFNKELQRYVSGEMDKNEILHLGNPQGVIKEFLPNLPIVMRQRIIKKGSEKRHNVDVAAIMDMPKSLSAPIFVFQRSTDTIGVLTDMKDREGKNVCVAIELNKRIQNGAVHLEVNDVRSFHGREFKNIIEPIVNNRTLMWADKEKGLAYLSSASHQVQQEIDKQVLISAANILKDFENPTIDGKNHIALSENALSAEASHDREAMRNEAVQLSDKLHTPIKIVEDVKDITHSNAEVERRKRNSKGWYDVRTGEVVVVLPNNRDVEDVAATVMHETVAHKGLRELVGEEHYDDFLDEVYEHLRGDLKQRVDAEAGRSFVDDSTKNGERAKSYEQHRRTAVDELFGDMAEKPFEEFSEGERTLWQKLKEVVRKLLDKFLESLKLPKWFELGDNELRYMLWRSKERLERGKEHPIDMARDMVMREELGLSDAARMRMGDTPDTFKARQRRAVKEKGVVMPGLNDAEVKVVDVPRHQYKDRNILDQARDAAIERYNKQVGTNEDGTPKWEAIPQEYNNYGISFFYEITPKALKSLVQHHTKSDNVGVHAAVLDKLHEVINGSIEYEEDPDVPKINGIRDISKGVNDNVLIHRFIGTVRVDGKTYRVISKIKEYRETHINARPSTYQVTEIGVFDNETPNTPNGSKRANGYVHVAKLLKDVEKSYDSGKKVLDESRKADENPILYRDGEETEDIWKDKSMGLHERTTAAAMRLADKHQENKTLRNDAMRAIGNNLADLRKAMSLQRKFDMATVKRVSRRYH